MHVQVCTLHRCQSIPVYVFVNTLSAGCAHATRVHVVCSLVMGDEVVDVPIVYAGDWLLAGVRGYLTCEKIQVLSVLSVFLTGGECR